MRVQEVQGGSRVGSRAAPGGSRVVGPRGVQGYSRVRPGGCRGGDTTEGVLNASG